MLTFVWLFVAVITAALAAKRNKTGQAILPVTFAFLAFFCFALHLLDGFVKHGGYGTLVWIAWWVAFIVTVLRAPFKVARAVIIVAATFAFIVSGVSAVLAPSNSSSDTSQSITVKGQTLELVSKSTQTDPVSGGSTTGDTNTKPTLDDGKGPVVSWTNLVERVNALPEARKTAYIDAINQRSEYLGTWDDVKKYVAIEKAEKLDTRVILVLNSSLDNQSARDLVRKDVGDAVDKLPVVHAAGALINTRGVDAGKIENFADGRNQVRVILTIPHKEKGEKKHTANKKDAKNGTGVLTECTNPTTGVVPLPPTPTKSKPMPDQSTPSGGGSESSSPSKKPSDKPSSETPESPKPSGSPTPEEKCPYNSELPKDSKECKAPESPKPSDTPKPPTSESPKPSDSPTPDDTPSEEEKCPYNSELPKDSKECKAPKGDTNGDASKPPVTEPTGQDSTDPADDATQEESTGPTPSPVNSGAGDEGHPGPPNSEDPDLVATALDTNTMSAFALPIFGLAALVTLGLNRRKSTKSYR